MGLIKKVISKFSKDSGNPRVKSKRKNSKSKRKHLRKISQESRKKNRSQK